MKQEPISQAIGDWIYRETFGKSNVLSAKEIAERIKIYRKQDNDFRPVTADQLGSVLTGARKHMELKYRLTLWNIRSMGWRCASPKETAYYGMATTKKLLVLADRTRRLVDIVDRKYIPEAFDHVFGNTESSMKTLLTRGKKFLTMWVDKQKETSTNLIGSANPKEK